MKVTEVSVSAVSWIRKAAPPASSIASQIQPVPPGEDGIPRVAVEPQAPEPVVKVKAGVSAATPIAPPHAPLVKVGATSGRDLTGQSARRRQDQSTLRTRQRPHWC